jgi:hypothetical protein
VASTSGGVRATGDSDAAPGRGSTVSFLLLRDATGWNIAAFQNTRPTQY